MSGAQDPRPHDPATEAPGPQPSNAQELRAQQPSAQDPTTRARLEDLAYGRASTPDELESARAARAELARLSAVVSSSDEHPSPASAGSACESEHPAISYVKQSPRARPSRLSLIVAAVAVAAVALGFVGGVAASGGFGAGVAGSDGIASTAARASAGADDSAATSRLAGGDPATSASPVAAARSLFASAQTSGDKYPFVYRDDQSYKIGSTRLIEQTPTGGKVWVAESAVDPGGFCLLTLEANAFGGSQGGQQSCVTEKQFADSGIDITADSGVDARWIGGTVTVTHPPQS